jgi:hypothetical protein
MVPVPALAQTKSTLSPIKVDPYRLRALMNSTAGSKYSVAAAGAKELRWGGIAPHDSDNELN